MITLLARWLIKDYKDVTSPGGRLKYGMLSGLAGIFLNILLFLGKLFAGTASGSIAITTDAFNNLSDAGSSVVTLIGFRLAAHKADPDHPFGHGRIEYIAGLVVAMVIFLMGFELLKSSVNKIARPEAMEFSLLTFIILVCSICIKLYMALYNRRIGEKIKSAAMKAISTDSLSDSAATTVVLIAMIIFYATGLNIDGYCGLLVSLFIFIAGFRAAKETLSPLLGQPPAPEYVKQVEDIVMAYDQVSGIHDLIVHNYGPGRIMISLHAEVPSNGDLLLLHDTIDNIEQELRTVMGCDAVVHMDPIVTDDELTGETREKIILLLKEIDPRFTIHDFRMVQGPTHTNVIFDVVVPFGITTTHDDIKKQVVKMVSLLDGHYSAVVQIDQLYV
ncbi:MAG: cation diffusion facilitator family transporter [Christensenellales bacterium]